MIMDTEVISDVPGCFINGDQMQSMSKNVKRSLH